MTVSRRFMVAGLAAAVACPEIARSEETSRSDRFVYPYYPPLMIDHLSAQPGLSIEIVRRAAQIAERSVEFENLPFVRSLKTVQRRSGYFQPALYRNPAREPDYAWIVETHKVVNVFSTLDRRIDSLDEARALGSIGVEEGAAMDVLLTEQAFANLQRVDRPEINAQKLAAGRIDAWALTRSLAHWTWRSAGMERPLVSGAPITVSPVYIVGNRDTEPEVVDAYRKAVDEMRSDGSLERILERYGEAPPRV